MKVRLNDTVIDVPENTSLQQLLQQYLNIHQDKKGIAIAVNSDIIPKSQWAENILSENDEILVIIAAQGG